MDEHYLSRLRGEQPQDAVDIWHLDLNFDHARWNVLTEDERSRARKIKIIEKRVQFVAGRSQLRHILASYLRSRPADIELEYGDHGKPFIRSGPPLSFNLSHSHSAGLLVVTAADDVPLGVDIELCSPGRRFVPLAQRFFSEAEYQDLNAKPADEVADAFYRTWACKEAYLKACGTGLSFPSNQFTVRCHPDRKTELLASQMPGQPGPWHFHPIVTTGDYAASVCYSGERRWLRHFFPLKESGS